MTRTVRTALFALLALAGSAAAAATPCDAPEQFVRQPKIATAPAAVDGLPLLRPYLLAGLPVVALREEGGQRWLELAVFSADDARRQLASRAAAAGSAEPAIRVRDAKVWLRCPEGASGT
jgi:uncharacterized membrane protein